MTTRGSASQPVILSVRFMPTKIVKKRKLRTSVLQSGRSLGAFRSSGRIISISGFGGFGFRIGSFRFSGGAVFGAGRCDFRRRPQIGGAPVVPVRRRLRGSCVPIAAAGGLGPQAVRLSPPFAGCRNLSGTCLWSPDFPRLRVRSGGLRSAKSNLFVFAPDFFSYL